MDKIGCLVVATLVECPVDANRVLEPNNEANKDWDVPIDALDA
jgi:hypothetical protein